MDLPRQTVEDPFHGHVLRLADVTLLSTPGDSAVETLASGPLLLRYGLVCLETPQLCLVPELVVMEYGELLSGEAAWDFLLHHSNLHPRAEVLGLRDDGVEDQLRVSRLDLAQTPRVLVWPAESAGDDHAGGPAPGRHRRGTGLPARALAPVSAPVPVPRRLAP